MKKSIVSIILTAVVCASVMLAVIGIYRLIATPILKDPARQAVYIEAISIL